ncbi:MAG: hypothetical protein AAGG38_02895, partial [Planctomycetota bacterium]
MSEPEPPHPSPPPPPGPPGVPGKPAAAPLAEGDGDAAPPASAAKPQPVAADDAEFGTIPTHDSRDEATPTGDTPGKAVAATAPLEGKRPRVVLCPYCGYTQKGDTEKCGDCGGLFEPLSRRATQIAMGPWTLRDKAHPFRPGCSYPVLVKMIEAGRVTPMTVLRGPTTRQFWSIARNVPGVAHLLGYCHACGKHVNPTDTNCPHCAAVFRGVKTRNELGLQFPTRRAAESAQRSLNRILGVDPEEGDGPADGSDGLASEAAHDSAPVDPAIDPMLPDETDAELVAAAQAPAVSGSGPAASIFEQDGNTPIAGPADNLLAELLGQDATAPDKPSAGDTVDPANPAAAERPEAPGMAPPGPPPPPPPPPPPRPP